MNYIVGVDIGGTFTDCVVVDEEGTITIGKALSTPVDFAHGALTAVGDAAKNIGLKDAEDLLSSSRLFFHAALSVITPSLREPEQKPGSS